LFEEVSKELNITVKYVNMNIGDKDPFVQNDNGFSLKSFTTSMEIDDYSIMKIDENNISIRLVGKEVSLIRFEKLVNEYMKSLAEIKESETKLTQLKKSNKSF
jgi:hypothetical protein